MSNQFTAQELRLLESALYLHPDEDHYGGALFRADLIGKVHAMWMEAQTALHNQHGTLDAARMALALTQALGLKGAKERAESRLHGVSGKGPRPYWAEVLRILSEKD